MILNLEIYVFVIDDFAQGERRLLRCEKNSHIQSSTEHIDTENIEYNYQYKGSAPSQHITDTIDSLNDIPCFYGKIFFVFDIGFDISSRNHFALEVQ